MDRSTTTRFKKKQLLVATRYSSLWDAFQQASLLACLLTTFLVSIPTNSAAQTLPPAYDENTPIYEHGQVLVKLEEGITPNMAEQISLDVDAIVTTIPNLQARLEVWDIPIGQVNTPDGTAINTVEEAIAYLDRQPGVVYVQPNFLYYLNGVPNDPSYNNMWGLDNKGQTSGTDDSDIDAPEAWSKTTGGKSRIAGVIDTGVDYNHEDLTPNIWNNLAEDADGDGKTLEWYADTQSWELDRDDIDGIDNDNNGYVDDLIGWDFANNDNDPMDTQGHGTHVSGTIAAVGNNGIGITGVCWAAQIMSLKIFEGSSGANTLDIIQSIEYAAQMGADVTNNSWGIPQDVPELYPDFDLALQEAITKVNKLEKLLVFSAGNDGKNTDIAPNYPSGYVHPEFKIPNLISVAASDHHDRLASFGSGRGSNFGFNTVDIAAPGHSILSCLPNNKYASWSGTSMAAPHVTGAALLIWAHYPNWTHLQVKERLLESVDLLPTLQFKVRTNGRLNVARAMGIDDCTLAADFTNTASSNVACTKDSITFTPATTQPNWSYQWTIDGVSYSTDPSFTISFEKSGQYEVELTINNDLLEDCSLSSSQTVIIQPTPIPQLAIYTDCASKKFIIQNDSEGVGSTNYTWLINGVEVNEDNNSPFEYNFTNFEETYTFALIAKNGPCRATYDTQITPTNVVADFSAMVNEADCTQSQYQFLNTSLEEENGENRWFVNDELVASSINLDYTFPTTGEYTVRLELTAHGCTATKEQTINVTANLKAGFTYEDNAINCGETTITFTSNPLTNENVMIRWNIDGDIILDDPVVADYPFTTAGDYVTQLTLTDMLTNCSDTAVDTISISPKPTAGFTYETINCDGDNNTFEVAFTPQVTASGDVGYTWTIDGTTYTTATPTHSFNTSTQQSFNGSLSVNNGGCESDLFETTIQLPIIPKITGIQQNRNCDGGFIALEALLNTADLTNLNFEWSVNNNIVNADGTIYNLPIKQTGNRSISITVSDDNCSSTFTETILVTQPPAPAFSYTCQAGSLQLVNESITNGNNNISYSWRVNGEEFDNQPNPISYGIDTAGTYYVELILTTNDCTVSHVNEITINEPNTSFSYAVNDLQVVATPSLPGAEQYFWDFGDGNTSSDLVPTHAYALAGAYQLCLTVTDCIVSTPSCQSVTVQNSPASTPTGQDSLEVVKLYLSLHGATVSSFIAAVNNSTQDIFPLLNTSDPIADWKSWVALNEDGRVTGVTLTDLFPDSTQQVIGSFPQLDLPELTTLILSNNRIGGTLNTAGLPKLHTLNLADNAISGILPDFSTQDNLTNIDLTNNEFSGTFPNLSHLTSLKDVFIANNKFTFDGLEQAVQDFADLVDNGTFIYAPQANIPLAKEKQVDNSSILAISPGGTVADNQYQWWYRTIASTTWEVVATDPTNPNQHIPAEKGWYRAEVTNDLVTRTNKAGEEQNLVLYSDSVNIRTVAEQEEAQPEQPANNCDSLELKKIYDAVDDPSALDEMGWFQEGIPMEEWGGIEVVAPPFIADTCARITAIDLSNKGLVGTCPALTLPALQHFTIQGNQFSGDFPTVIADNLEQFIIDHNNFSGDLPIDLNHLAGLASFGIANNAFTGAFPDISTWTNLKQLNTANNPLAGSLPNLENLTQLDLVNISNNQLTGGFPNVANATALEKLEIQGNQFSGSAPDFRGLNNLHDVDFSHNNFTFDGLKRNVEWILNESGHAMEISKFIYAPQDSIPLLPQDEDGLIIINASDNSITLQVDAGGLDEENTYRWFKDGNFLLDKTGVNTLEVTSEEAGQYQCKIINSEVTATGFDAPNEGQNLILNTESAYVEESPSNCPPEIVADRTDFTLCGEGDQIVLSANATYDAYTWYKDGLSTGETTATLTITEAGSYYLLVGACSDTSNILSINTCNTPTCPENYDSILVGTLPDTSLCIGESIIIPTNVDASTYIWTNTETGALISDSASATIDTSGIYRLYTALNCYDENNQLTSVEAIADTFVVVINEDCPDTPDCVTEIVVENEDNTLCGGMDSVVVASAEQKGSYEWTDEESNLLSIDSSYVIYDVGDYILTTVDEAGCMSKDTVKVRIELGGDCPSECAYPAHIMGDFILCKATDSTTLSLLHGIEHYDTVEWRINGLKQNPIGDSKFVEEVKVGNLAPNSSILVSVTVVDMAGCKSTSTVTVYAINGSITNSESTGCTKIHPIEEAALCTGDSVTLDPGVHPVYTWYILEADGSRTLIKETPFDDNGEIIRDQHDPYLTVYTPGTYIVETRDYQHGPLSGEDAYYVRAFDIDGAQIQLLSSLCNGDSTQLSVLPVNDRYGYEWSLDNLTSTEITIHDAGIYEVTITDIINGCSITRSIDVLTQDSPPEPSIITNAPLCVGDSVTIDIIGIDPAFDYVLHQMTADNTYDPVPITADLSLKEPIFATTTLEVTVTNPQTMCTTVITETIGVLDAPPIPEVNPPALACAGDSITLSIENPETTTTTYTWDTEAPIVSLSDTSIRIIVTDTTTIIVTATDQNTSCQSSASIPIIVAPVPNAPEIIYPDSVCVGTDTLLTIANVQEATTYHWFETGSEISFHTGESVRIPIIATTNITIIAINDSTACQNDTTITIYEKNAPMLANLDLPAEGICAYVSTTLTIDPIEPNVTYSWFIGDQAEFIGTEWTYTFDQDTSITIIAQHNETGCTSNSLIPITIRDAPQQPEIIPIGLVCDSDSVMISIDAPDPQATYTWFESGSTEAFDTGTTITYTPTSTTTIAVVATNENTGCISDTTFIPIEVVPLPNTPDVSHPTAVCSGTDVPLKVTDPQEAITYSWFFGDSEPAFAIGDSTMVIITQDTTIRIVATNDTTGCESAYTITINKQNAPMPANLDLPAEGICAYVPTVLTIDPTEPNVTYRWFIHDMSEPKFIGTTWTQTFDQDTTIVIIAQDNETGCTSSSTILITIRDAPQQPVVDQPEAVCGNSPITIGVKDPEEQATYEWFNEGEIIPFDTGVSIDYEVTANTTISVVATHETTGCVSDTTTVPIVLYPQPLVAITTEKNTICPKDTLGSIGGLDGLGYGLSIYDDLDRGTYLTASLESGTTGISYEWFKNGTLINNEITNVIYIDEKGTYVVRVTNEFSCVHTDTFDVYEFSKEAPRIVQDLNCKIMTVTHSNIIENTWLEKPPFWEPTPNRTPNYLPKNHDRVAVTVKDENSCLSSTYATGVPLFETKEDNSRIPDNQISVTISKDSLLHNDIYDADIIDSESITFGTPPSSTSNGGQVKINSAGDIEYTNPNISDLAANANPNEPIDSVEYQFVVDANCSDIDTMFQYPTSGIWYIYPPRVLPTVAQADLLIIHTCTEPFKSVYISPDYSKLGLSYNGLELNLSTAIKIPNTSNILEVHDPNLGRLKFTALPLSFGLQQYFIPVQDNAGNEGTLHLLIDITEDCPNGKQKVKAIVQSDQESGTLGTTYSDTDNGEIDLDEQMDVATIASSPTQITEKAAATTLTTHIQNIKVRPIPAKDMITLDFTTERAQSVQIEIYSVVGQQLGILSLDAQVGLNQQAIDISKYPVGNYFLRIIGDTSVEKAKFVKN